MNHVDQNTSTQTSLVGAISTCAEDDSSDNHLSPLPMIVWLRGDESYAGEFSLDAEAVMESIGIKRSRLTQISGRELRVGRIRVDRYIRPMYRSCDVQEYKSWTRASASHSKSSTILKEAADELRSGSKELADQFLVKLGDVHQSIEAALKDVCSETYEIQKNASQLMQEQMTHNRQSFEASSQSVIESIEAPMSQIVEGVQKALESNQLQDISTELERLSHMQVATEQQQKILEQLREQTSSLNTNIDTLGVRQNSLDQQGAETFQVLFESTGQIKESLEQHSRFNRKVAEALTKIIELQRDLSMVCNATHRAVSTKQGMVVTSAKGAKLLPYRLRQTMKRSKRTGI